MSDNVSEANTVFCEAKSKTFPPTTFFKKIIMNNKLFYRIWVILLWQVYLLILAYWFIAGQKEKIHNFINDLF